MITSAQCRAARALLKWTQDDLAGRSGISPLAINKFEVGKTSPHVATLKVLRETFEAAGIEFIDDSGLKLGRPEGDSTGRGR